MGEWISVKDRLPENRNTRSWNLYLVAVTMQGGFNSRYIADFYPAMEKDEYGIGNSLFWEIDNGPDSPYEVTHWMELPKHPLDIEIHAD